MLLLKKTKNRPTEKPLSCMFETVFESEPQFEKSLEMLQRSQKGRGALQTLSFQNKEAGRSKFKTWREDKEEGKRRDGTTYRVRRGAHQREEEEEVGHGRRQGDRKKKNVSLT